MFAAHRLIAWSVLVGVALLAGPASRAVAAEGLRSELHELSKKIKELMDGQRIDAIAVGEFTGQEGMFMNAGSQIKDVLTKELTALKVTVKSPANYEIKGDYRPYEDADTKMVGMKITAMVFDANGIVANFKLAPRGVHGNTDVYEMGGVTADMSPAGGQESRNNQLKKALYNPSCHVDGARVCTKQGSPYAVEVLVKRGGAYLPTPARQDKGLAFVSLRKDDVYAVRLHNDTDYEVGVQVTVDGLSMFRFSEQVGKNGQPFQYVIVAPRSHLDVKGWFVNLDYTDEFRIVPQGQARIGQFKTSSKVGVITVAFVAAWEKGNAKKRPSDEPQARSVETDRGNTIAQNFKEVERDYGAVRSTISVRYNK